ncbi:MULTISPECIES: hypothetical protein [unclassified Sulfuricurvum]|uniref:hypothetical protein n=1 Tax=unclassified Sulfuricurvum TaxID=2632390 RepID=UPI000A4EB5F8|nr:MULTISPECIES: hypothetical protein [unclassified Sulfuricurvum]
MNDNNLLNNSSAVSNLVKNPLGIIGLFILLVYGIASLLIGIGGKTIFSESQIWLLVVFLIGFPLIVLAVFYWLVTRYHEKLYAPKDYQNDDAFLKTISITKASKEEIRDKYEKEQIIQNAIVQVSGVEAKSSMDEVNFTVADEYIPTPSAIITDEYIPSPMDLLSYNDIMDLEEKAIRRIEQKYSIEFDRNVKLEFEDDPIIIDAGYINSETKQFYIAEIKILKSSFAAEIINALILRFIQIQAVFNRVEINLLIGIIHDENKILIDSKIKKLTKDLPIKVQLEYFNLLDLKKETNDL